MKVLLILLAVLLVLLLLPFGALVRYDREGFMAWVKVLFLRFQVFPPPPKKEKKEKKKKKQEPPKEKPPAQPKEPAPKEKKGGTLTLVRSALPLVGPALSGLKKRLTINDLELSVTWAASNPADAAMGYGYANAALGTLWGVIEPNFKVKKSRLGCDVDFDAADPTVYLNAFLTINLWKTLTLVLPLLVRFLRNYTRLKREQDEKTKKEV